jgi:hypothetical protein
VGVFKVGAGTFEMKALRLSLLLWARFWSGLKPLPRVVYIAALVLDGRRGGRIN